MNKLIGKKWSEIPNSEDLQECTHLEINTCIEIREYIYNNHSVYGIHSEGCFILKGISKVGEGSYHFALDNINHYKNKFHIVLSEKLKNKYEFKDMTQKCIANFHNFLSKILGTDKNDVFTKYRKKDEKKKKDNHTDRIIHIGEKGFRLHGIMEESALNVKLIDPKHQVHKQK